MLINQSQKDYSNAIDPEVIDCDVSMSGKNVNGGDNDDQYYDTKETLDNEDMDEDVNNNVMEDEDDFKGPSEDEAKFDNTNNSEHNQPAEEQSRTILDGTSKPYDHNMKVGSRMIPRIDDNNVSRLLLFKTDHTPTETQFSKQMMNLERYDLLNVSMPSFPCSRVELQLVEAIKTRSKNTKDLETKIYKGNWRALTIMNI